MSNPRPGQYSKAYLDGIVAAVRMLARHGLMSLVDFHQDFYNARFGGQGMADWMVVDDGFGDIPVALTPNTILRALQPSGARVWDNFWANRAGERRDRAAGSHRRHVGARWPGGCATSRASSGTT